MGIAITEALVGKMFKRDDYGTKWHKCQSIRNGLALSKCGKYFTTYNAEGRGLRLVSPAGQTVLPSSNCKKCFSGRS